MKINVRFCALYPFCTYFCETECLRMVCLYNVVLIWLFSVSQHKIADIKSVGKLRSPAIYSTPV